jgi:hypothetical protein
MKTPHVHAEVIKAWADGAEIEWFSKENKEWIKDNCPLFLEASQYRIKPEPKPDIVRYFGVDNWHGSDERISGIMDYRLANYSHWDNQLKLTFDGKTNKLKAVEIIK